MSSTPTPGRKLRFSLIEAARGIAALLVVLHHAGAMISEPRFWSTDPFAGHLRNFNVGVDFFFVLSGFIITWVHWDDLGRVGRLGDYARRRLLRIFPPYWGVLLPLIVFYLVVPLAGKPYQHHPLDIALSVVLLPNVDQPILGVAWTLTYELFFYAVFAAIIATGRRGLLVLPLWAALILTANVLFSPLSFPVSFLLSPFNLEFIIGVGAAALLRRYAMPLPILLLAAGAGAFLSMMLLWLHIQDDPLRGRLCFGLAALLFVLGAVELERAVRLPPLRPLVFLGAASYAIYLSHTVVLILMIQGLHRHIVHAMSADAAAVALSVVAVGAGCAYHLTGERLLTRWAKLLLVKPRGSAFVGDIRPPVTPAEPIRHYSASPPS